MPFSDKTGRDNRSGWGNRICSHGIVVRIPKTSIVIDLYALIFVFRDDHVIEEVNAHDFPRLYDLAGDFDIRVAWRCRPRGMVVREDYSRRSVFDRGLEHFARMDEVRIYGADRDRLIVDDLLAVVQIYAPEVFFGEILHIPEIMKHVFGGTNRP